MKQLIQNLSSKLQKSTIFKISYSFLIVIILSLLSLILIYNNNLLLANTCLLIGAIISTISSYKDDINTIKSIKSKISNK